MTINTYQVRELSKAWDEARSAYIILTHTQPNVAAEEKLQNIMITLAPYREVNRKAGDGSL